MYKIPWCPTYVKQYVLGSKLSLFSYGRDGHQPHSRGLYMAAAQNVRSGSSPGPTNDPDL